MMALSISHAYETALHNRHKTCVSRQAPTGTQKGYRRPELHRLRDQGHRTSRLCAQSCCTGLTQSCSGDEIIGMVDELYSTPQLLRCA